MAHYNAPILIPQIVRMTTDLFGRCFAALDGERLEWVKYGFSLLQRGRNIDGPLVDRATKT